MTTTKKAGGLLLFASLLLVGARAPADFETNILAAHNLERSRLGLKPLNWNDELAHGAKQWSEYLAATGRFEHSPDEPNQPRIGENIWGGTPGRFGTRRKVAAWIAEKRHFKPGVFPANSTTTRVEDVSHYTQIIWRDTHEVGCSVSRGKHEEILVCRYHSPGNVIGTRPI
ncbi:CAP domain-containing protein [Erythrobacter sp. QSSC1-22B]|uniref:CAP domain-containing protein n=1 Tax=Erythrobacter sp. QSSC1-22B TaxID=1860125 RepID=UPI0009F48071|nr:CAP domain-containing protein [Erythrobacter sp. QSSC1-22B]